MTAAEMAQALADARLATQRLWEENHQLRSDNAKLRETIRAQGEFIYRMKHEIRDFLDHPPVSLGRAIADRGLRDATT